MGKYTEVDHDEQGREVVNILEEGHITPSNITSMKFEFSKPTDITGNLDKRNTKNPNPDIPSNPGRTGYSGATVIYPNGEKSTRAVFTECVIQYRKAMLSDSGKDYGSTYVNIGIPRQYLDTLFNSARTQPEHNIRLENKEKTREKSGYYWIDCDIRRLNFGDIWIIWKDDEGNTQGANRQIRDLLTGIEENLECTITVSISGSITNRNKLENLDLDRGTYHPSFKLYEVVVRKESEVESPDLAEFSSQARNEKSEKTEASLASGKVRDLALGRLKIG